MSNSAQLEICFPVFGGTLQLPYVSDLSEGFSPEDATIDLNEELSGNKASVFYGKVRRSAMNDDSIRDGDLLVIDRSKGVKDGALAVCFLDGEYTVKRIRLEGNNCCWLVTEEADQAPLKITYENDFVVWGIVTHTIRQLT